MILKKTSTPERLTTTLMHVFTTWDDTLKCEGERKRRNEKYKNPKKSKWATVEPKTKVMTV